MSRNNLLISVLVFGFLDKRALERSTKWCKYITSQGVQAQIHYKVSRGGANTACHVRTQVSKSLISRHRSALNALNALNARASAELEIMMIIDDVVTISIMSVFTKIIIKCSLAVVTRIMERLMITVTAKEKKVVRHCVQGFD